MSGFPTLIPGKALQLEDKIGAMVPCNVILQETGESSGIGGR